MKASIQAYNMIKNFEGLRLVAYKPVPTEKLYTIGYGHYGIKGNLTITKSQAEIYLSKDVLKAEKAVNKYDPLYNFNQNEYDALVSFAFNVGSIKQLTDGGYRTKEEIGTCMLLYIKSGGKPLQGLITRRRLELLLYNTPVKGEIKSASQLAAEVVLGKWGNGESRKIKLKAYGYDYDEVQKYVNQLL